MPITKVLIWPVSVEAIASNSPLEISMVEDFGHPKGMADCSGYSEIIFGQAVIVTIPHNLHSMK